MKHETLSFGLALAAILVVFFTIQSFKGTEGQAQAAATGLAGKTIGQDAMLSASDKRAIRRTIMNSPRGIMELNGREVRAVLNQPELVRRDEPTVVWQYRNESCVLDVYFTTRHSKVAASPVAHYEIRAREVGVEDDAVQATCVADMVRERTGGVNFVNLDGIYKAN